MTYIFLWLLAGAIVTILVAMLLNTVKESPSIPTIVVTTILWPISLIYILVSMILLAIRGENQ